MENPEEVLQWLEDMTRRRPTSIPRALDDYLSWVARTGDPLYRWPLVRALLKEKLLSVLSEFRETPPGLDLPPCPNVPPFDCDAMRTCFLARLDAFPAPPFTVQRICELLVHPRKHYNRIDKFMRAFEKNVLVVSAKEPEPFRRAEPPDADADAAEPQLDGSDANSDCNVDVEMEDASDWKDGPSAPRREVGDAPPERRRSVPVVESDESSSSAEDDRELELDRQREIERERELERERPRPRPRPRMPFQPEPEDRTTMADEPFPESEREAIEKGIRMAVFLSEANGDAHPRELGTVFQRDPPSTNATTEVREPASDRSTRTPERHRMATRAPEGPRTPPAIEAEVSPESSEEVSADGNESTNTPIVTEEASVESISGEDNDAPSDQTEGSSDGNEGSPVAEVTPREPDPEPEPSDESRGSQETSAGSEESSSDEKDEEVEFQPAEEKMDVESESVAEKESDKLAPSVTEETSTPDDSVEPPTTISVEAISPVAEPTADPEEESSVNSEPEAMDVGTSVTEAPVVEANDSLPAVTDNSPTEKEPIPEEAPAEVDVELPVPSAQIDQLAP